MDFGARLRARAARRNRGIGLVEIALGLGLAAFLLYFVITQLGTANSSNAAQQLAGQMTSIQQSVRALYGGQSTYTDLSNSVLIASDSLPQSQVRGTDGITNSFSGNIVVAPATTAAGAQTGFSVQVSNIPKDACVQVLTSDQGRGVYSMAGNGSARTQQQGLPFNPGDALAQCGNNYNTVTMVYF